MTQFNSCYGRRAKFKLGDTGVRQVAPTFGKVLHLTYSNKCSGELVVESNAERLFAHMLTLDPRVITFRTQPFTVDLIDQRLLKTPDEVTVARKKHGQRVKPKFYTPDFEIIWKSEPRSVIEVKLEGYEGDQDFQTMLRLASSILEANGYRYARVVLPADPRHPLRNNLPLLKMAANRMDLWPNDCLVQRIETVCAPEPVALKELCNKLGLSPNLVPALLVSGCIAGNLTAHSLNGAMQLKAAYGDLGHLELIGGVLV